MSISRRAIRYLGYALLASLMSGPISVDAGAAESGLLSEVKFGILVHDIAQNHKAENSIDFNLELDFAKLDIFDTGNKVLDFILSPKPMIGASINSAGDTHYGYAGLNWKYEFENGIFVSPSFDLAIHTGRLHQLSRPCTADELADACARREPVGLIYVEDHKPRLGSRVLFREGIEIGYRFTGGHSVSLFVTHLSQGGFFDHNNDGMNFVGIRYGYILNWW